MRDLDQELEAYDPTPPESWKPRPGDKIVGEVIRYDNAEGAYGPCWVAVLKVPANQDHGEYLAGVWLSHKVLFEKFRRLRPQRGEKIGIKRLPDAEKGYARYAVVVDRAGDDDPPWDELSGSELPGVT